MILGRPLLLGEEIDSLLCIYLKALRRAGTTINGRIAVAALEGIIQIKNPNLLKSNGGPIDCEYEQCKPFLKSLWNRLDWVCFVLYFVFYNKHFCLKKVQRKATNSRKVIPDDFNERKKIYITRINMLQEELKVPDELIINWDQTALNYVPTGNYTMHPRGDHQVQIEACGM